MTIQDTVTPKRRMRQFRQRVVPWAGHRPVRGPTSLGLLRWAILCVVVVGVLLYLIAGGR
jgi:hypothetical protein